MPTSTLTKIEVWSNLECAAGAWLETVRSLDAEATSVVATYDVDGNSTLELTIPATDPAVPYLRPRCVLRVEYVDAGTGATVVEEWRLHSEERLDDGEFGRVAVTATHPLLDLADVGPLCDVSLAEAPLAGKLSQATYASFFSTLLGPFLAAQGLGYITAGTVGYPTQLFDWEWDNENPLTVLRKTFAGKYACEITVARTGATGYSLFAPTELNIGVPQGVLGQDTWLRTVRRSYDVAEQTTRLFVQGDGQTTIARTVWRCVAKSGTVLALADPEGRGPPIAYGNQFAGFSLRRLLTGRTYPIGASSASGVPNLGAGDFQISGASTAALASINADWATGELFELATSPADNTFAATTRTTLPGGEGYNPLGIQIAAPSGLTAVASIDTAFVYKYAPHAASLAASLRTPATDLLDLRCEVWRLLGQQAYPNNPVESVGGEYTTLTTTGSTTYPWRLVRSTWNTSTLTWNTADRTIPAQGTLAVGDVLMFEQPTPRNSVFVGVVSATTGAWFALVDFFTGGPLPVNQAVPGAGVFDGSVVSEGRAYRRQTPLPRVDAFNPATNTLTFDSATGLVAGDRLVFRALPEPNKYLTGLVDTFAESTLRYGPKGGVMTLDGVSGVRNETGESGHFRDWAGTVPRGWSLTGGAVVKDTTDALYPTGCLLMEDAVLLSPTIHRARRGVESLASFRLPYKVASGVNPATVSITAWLLDVTWRRGAKTTTTLGVTTATGANLTVGAWVDLVFDGITIPADARDLQVQISVVSDAPARVRLGGLAVYFVGQSPQYVADYSGCNELFATALAILPDRSNPLASSASYEVEINDKWRAGVAGASSYVLGQLVNLDVTRAKIGPVGLRIVRMVVDRSRPDVTTLTLARRPSALTRTLAEKLSIAT